MNTESAHTPALCTPAPLPKHALLSSEGLGMGEGHPKPCLLSTTKIWEQAAGLSGLILRGHKVTLRVTFFQFLKKKKKKIGFSSFIK